MGPSLRLAKAQGMGNYIRRERQQHQHESTSAAVVRGVYSCAWEQRASAVAPLLKLHDAFIPPLCVASVIGTVVLLPSYIVGGNYYACGKLLVYSTVAYLADASAAEWVAAVGASIMMVGITARADCRGP